MKSTMGNRFIGLMNNGRVTILSLFIIFFASSAQASLITGFTGDYDVTNWVVEQSGDGLGSVDTSLSPFSVTIFEPDNGPNSTESEVTFFTTALTDLFITFDWSWDNTIDDCCSALNFYTSSVSSVEILNADNVADDVITGSFSANVLAGDVFGWGVWSEDTCCGANTATISNLTLDDGIAVPEPSTLAIFALGVIGLASRRFKN